MYGKNFDRSINIMGVQSDCGASMRGCDRGVTAIRNAGLVSTLRSGGFDVRDLGNITPDFPAIKPTTSEPISSLKNLNAVNSVNAKLYQLVKDALGYNPINKAKCGFPLVLGGDHSLSAASIMAANKVYGKVGVIWVDAHGDFNNHESSPSKNIHGMPLSAITGNGPNEILPFKEGEYINPKNSVIIGARALDRGEKSRLKQAGVTVFSMHEIDVLGMPEVLKRAIDIASGGTSGVYLSFDLDALDPSVVTDVGTPSEGGLTLREGRLLCEMLASSGKLIGMDMVELNPAENDAIFDNIDQMLELAKLNPVAAYAESSTASKSAQIALQLICAALGDTLI